MRQRWKTLQLNWSFEMLDKPACTNVDVDSARALSEGQHGSADIRNRDAVNARWAGKKESIQYMKHLVHNSCRLSVVLYDSTYKPDSIWMPLIWSLQSKDHYKTFCSV